MRWSLAFASALLLAGLLPSSGSATVGLATPTAARYPGGSVRCTAVNVGDAGDPSLDITLSLIDVATGEPVQTHACTGGDAVAPNKRCLSDEDDGATVLFCKATIDLVGGSGSTPNPATAILRQKVRVTIISLSADRNTLTVLPAE